MLNRIVFFLLIILFFLLPLINSHLLDLIGIKGGFYVKGNYEFTKVIFFNIFSGLIIMFFLIKSIIIKNKLIIPIIIISPLLIILIISTIFSTHTFTSLLGNNSKSHSLLMFVNLIGLFIVFININKKKLEKLIITLIVSTLFISIIGIKEFIFPTFDYGDLSNRAISTFGHPNYLALYIIILIPIINNYINISLSKQKKIFFSFILLITIINLFLTKSIWGIFIFFNYLIYYKYNKIINLINQYTINKKTNTKIIFNSLYLILIIIGVFFTIKYYPEKMQSFLSRFYIWKTVINIIFSDIKNIFIGSGLGTLEYIFDGFKNKELYIYENIGFTADRPHNLLLYTFYNIGIFGVLIIGYIVYLLKKTYKNNIYYNSIFIFLFFTILNFSSIIHYLIIILIGSIIYKNNNGRHLKYNCLLLSVICIISIFGIVQSGIYYLIEYEKHNYPTNNSTYNFNQKIIKEDYINNLVKNGLGDIELLCKKIIKYNNSVENYFYCGNIILNYNKIKAIGYYNRGLKKLPDMWNKNSIYYKNTIINKIFEPERFYSEKFSNIKEILKLTGKR